MAGACRRKTPVCGSRQPLGKWVCGNCLQISLHSPTSFQNIKSEIRSNLFKLVRAGGGKDKHREKKEEIDCKKCKQNAQHYKLVSLKPHKENLSGIPKLDKDVKKCIKALYYYEDALYKVTHNDPEDLQVDHRLPIDRMVYDKDLEDSENDPIVKWVEDQEETVNLLKDYKNEILNNQLSELDKEILEKINIGVEKHFQLLTWKDNSLKSSHCKKCVETDIMYYHPGMRTFFGRDSHDPKYVYAEGKLCEGCFWYNPNLWLEHFFEEYHENVS